MQAVCERELKIIYRFLEMIVLDIYVIFQKGLSNFLKCDVIIVDEMSMVDSFFMNYFFAVIKLLIRIVFVGDKDQFLLVGVGNVLKDFIKSEIVFCIILIEVYCQSENSFIVFNVYRINRGEYLYF